MFSLPSRLLLAAGLLAVVTTARAEGPAAVDLYGDPLPPGAVARMGTVRLRHGGWVVAVAVAPDGKTLAAGDTGGGVRLWDTTTGKERIRFSVGTDEGAALGRYNPICCISFHDEGKLVATVEGRGALHLWDVATGKERPCFPPTKYPCAVSPDGARIARRAERRYIGICDIVTGLETTTIRSAEVVGERFAFSPDGKLLAGADDSHFHVWDAASGKELVRLPSKGRVLAFAPDGKTLAFADCKGEGVDGLITLCDVEGHELKTLKGHRGGIDGLQALAFSGDGKFLVSAARDATVRIWDVGGGKEVCRFTEAVSVLTSVAYCPTRNVIAIGFQNGLHAVRLWDVDKRERLFVFPGHERPAACLAFSPDGRTLASAASLGGEQTIHLWDPKTGKEWRTLRGLEDGAYALAFSPDGRTLASGGGFDQTTVRLWDVGSGKERDRLHNEASILSLGYSPDGKRLAFGDCRCDEQGQPESRIQVWDADLRTRRLAFSGRADFITYSSDGSLLAVSPGPPSLVDAATGRARRRFPVVGGNGRFTLSPDGKFVAACADKALVVLEIASGREVFRREAAVCIDAPVFAPNGWILASGCQGEAVRLWDAWSGEEVRTFACPATVARLAFAPDGLTLASVCNDTTILVWDVSGLPGPPKAVEVDPGRMWDDLSGRDARAAYRAAGRMAAVPEKTVPFLKEHTPAIVLPDDAAVARIITDLDSNDFDVRERASGRLEAQGERVADALRQALDASPSPEIRLRVQILLPKVKDQLAPPERLLALRTTAVLERIASPEARRLLFQWAAGPAGADLTREAKAALDRLDRRDAAEH